MKFHELGPVFDSNSTTLILGSFPSETSRKQGFYYMHPTNRFWTVLSLVYNEEIIDKKEFILKHHLALWDVISSCEIKSSSDASIKNVSVNDISSLLDKSKITTIYTTGRIAYQLYNKYIYPKIKIPAKSLPSTSSANAAYSLDRLIKEYQQIKEDNNE